MLAALNLRGKRILIVGGGAVATRKLSAMLDAGAEIHIISPEITPKIADWVSKSLVNWTQAAYQTEALINFKPRIVFAATNDPELNSKIADDARNHGAIVNIASDRLNSDFHTVSSVEKKPIQVGIYTTGTSPALIKVLKERIGEAITDDLVQLALWLSEIRPIARETLETQNERQDLFRQIVESEILDLLQAGDTEAARARFEALTEDL